MKEWSQYLYAAYDEMVPQAEIAELGKILAVPNEHMQKDWINENTSVKVARRNDDDFNGAGYDLISEGGVRIQSKIRGGMSGKRPALYIEQTRRVSEKNKGAASTSGHVVPAVGESDVYVFTIPRGNYLDPTKAELLAIPEYELKDPKNPGFLVRSALKDVQEKYKGRAKEVLETLENGINA